MNFSDLNPFSRCPIDGRDRNERQYREFQTILSLSLLVHTTLHSEKSSFILIRDCFLNDGRWRLACSRGLECRRTRLHLQFQPPADIDWENSSGRLNKAASP